MTGLMTVSNAPSLRKQFLFFLAPMMLSNILQAMFNTINNVYHSQMIGVDALTTVSGGGPAGGGGGAGGRGGAAGAGGRGGRAGPARAPGRRGGRGRGGRGGAPGGRGL